jgi:hypothetical protein
MASPTPTQTLTSCTSRLPTILETYQKSLQKIDALERKLEEKVAEKRHRAVNLLDEISSHRRSTLRLYVTHQFQETTKCVPVKLPVTAMPVTSTATATATAATPVPGAPTVPGTTPAPAPAPAQVVNANGNANVNVNAASADSSMNPSTNGPSAPPTNTDQSGPVPAVAVAVQPAKPPEKMIEIKNNKWNLVIEGKLLTGHLDHESAVAMEHAAKVRAEKDGRRYVTQSSMVVDTADMTSRERAATRFMHDREGEEPVLPIKFSHFFDRISVSFQTFQKNADASLHAENASASASVSTTKTTRKGRRTSTTPKKTPLTPIKPKQKPKETYATTGPITSLFWNRHRPNPTNPSAPLQSALDTNAFHAIHTEKREPITKENAVVATIRLHRRDQKQKYKPSAKLCTTILPSLSPKKAKPTPIHEFQAPPKDNDVYIPSVLSMDDAIDAIYQYVLKHELQDKIDRRMIHNDASLEQLFGCKDMDMATVKELLLTRGLLVPCVVGTPGDSPIILTYVMKKGSGSKNQVEIKVSEIENGTRSGIGGGSGSGSESPSESAEPEPKRRRTTTPSPQPLPEKEDISPNILSCDVDIDVPHLYHSRCRDILRRIKIREYEYTSCRTKALRTVELTKAAEDVVKDRLENIVKGKALTVGHQPVLSALAKAAPSGSEARISAHADAKTSLLVERLEEHCERARACWEVVEMCRGGV